MDILVDEIEKVTGVEKNKINFIFFNFSTSKIKGIKGINKNEFDKNDFISNDNNVLVFKEKIPRFPFKNLLNQLAIVFYTPDEIKTSIDSWKKNTIGDLQIFYHSKTKKMSKKIYSKIFKSTDNNEEKEEREDKEKKIERKKSTPTKDTSLKSATSIISSNEPNFDYFLLLPEPTTENDIMNEKWRQEFYLYIKELLNIIVPDSISHTIPHILNEETLNDIWIPCFTSKYEKPNHGENYEVFELLGDSLMGYNFITYLYNRYFNLLNEDNSTILKQKYLSTRFQGLWGEKMKLHKWLIVPEGTYEMFSNNLKIKEDLLEAFCGALDNVYNKKVSNGLGGICVYNMIKLVFEKHEFELEVKPVKTTILQLMEMIDTDRIYRNEGKIVIKRPKEINEKIWDNITDQTYKILGKNNIEGEIVSEGKETKDRGIKEEISLNNEGFYITKVYLKKSGSDVLKKKGINIKPNTVIGKSISSTLKPGSEDAYKDALNYLATKGITSEWIKEKQKEKNKIGLKNVDKALMKARNENKKIIEVTIEEAKKLKGDSLYQIIGYDKNNKKYVVYNFVPGKDKKDDNPKQSIINDYLYNG